MNLLDIEEPMNRARLNCVKTPLFVLLSICMGAWGCNLYAELDEPGAFDAAMPSDVEIDRCADCADGEYCIDDVCVFPSRCSELSRANPAVESGPVSLRDASGSTFDTYCEMELEGGGWTRIGLIDPRQSRTCPDSFQLYETPFVGCSKIEGELVSAVEHEIPHTFDEVMGRAIGLAYGSPDQFRRIPAGSSANGNLAEPFLDGVSVTLETRDAVLHVWSWAAAFTDSPDIGTTCPCNDGPAAPDVVGPHYSCEAGTAGNPNSAPYIWFVDDELWDGGDDPSDCSSSPRFLRTLTGTPEMSFETRLMTDQRDDDEDVAIIEYELYIR